MQGKGAGPVNRVELESQVLCAALRQSCHVQERIGAFTSVRELSHLFPDLLPPPEQHDEHANSNKSNYYALLKIKPQTAANGVLASYLRAVRRFLRRRKPSEERIEYSNILNAGFVLRKPRLRLSHDLVVARRWLHEEARQAENDLEATKVSQPIATAPVAEPARSVEKPVAPLSVPESKQSAAPVDQLAQGPVAPPVPKAVHAQPAVDRTVKPVAPPPSVAPPQAAPAADSSFSPMQPAAGASSGESRTAPAQQSPVQAADLPAPQAAPLAAKQSEPSPQAEPLAVKQPEPSLQADPKVTAQAAPQPIKKEAFGMAEPLGFPPAAVRAQATAAQTPAAPAATADASERKPGRIGKEAAFVFDESQLRKPTSEVGEVAMLVRLLEAAQIISAVEVQALQAQLELAPNIPVERHILNAGYVNQTELASVKLGENLLQRGKITMAQFQVAIYDERNSGLRMADSLQVRGWLSVEVRNAIDDFHKKPQ